MEMETPVAFSTRHVTWIVPVKSGLEQLTDSGARKERMRGAAGPALALGGAAVGGSLGGGAVGVGARVTAGLAVGAADGEGLAVTPPPPRTSSAITTRARSAAAMPAPTRIGRSGIGSAGGGTGAPPGSTGARRSEAHFRQNCRVAGFSVPQTGQTIGGALALEPGVPGMPVEPVPMVSSLPGARYRALTAATR